MAATSGEGDATHELWPRVERISLFHLLLIACSWSQTIGVKPIDPVNILSSQAGAITSRVRDQTTKYAQTVDRGQALQDALDEQALRQSGAMSNPDDNLNLETADQIISGSAGLSATGRWFINLTLINVNTGRVIGSKDATVSSYHHRNRKDHSGSPRLPTLTSQTWPRHVHTLQLLQRYGLPASKQWEWEKGLPLLFCNIQV